VMAVRTTARTLFLMNIGFIGSFYRGLVAITSR